jgi:ribosome biogenesis GTPase
MADGIKKLHLEDLGYSDFFESNRKKLKLDNFQIARVIAEYKEAYKVKNSDGECLAKVTGKQIFNASSRENFPAVGDWVAITELDARRALINGILPRRTIIKRKYSNKNEIQVIAANIDVALVVESVDRDFSLNRFERYFAIARDGGVKPVVILNKTDLIPKKELEIKLSQVRDRFSDTDVILTTTVTDSGLEELKIHITQGNTYCFLGSSGVGKSSLINKLIGNNIIKTGNISPRTGRGKHVTTNREMFFLENGGIVIDNPGMREVGMSDTGYGIDDVFNEISNLASKCRYSDCTHIHEPGCEVLSELKAGKLGRDKYSNYVNLKKESEYYEMTKLERREKDRQFGKFIKKAKEQLKGYKY